MRSPLPSTRRPSASTRDPVRVGAMVVLVSLLVATARPAEAAKLFVENHGVDSPTCGGKKAPCRSISQAIDNAVPNDGIVVGPGRYGDLDGDGLFGGVGEEQAETGGGCFCMIKVDKPLSIESRDGANATVLDANDTGVGVVSIVSSGVVFGKKKKGFTLTSGDDGAGVETRNDTSGVTITANVATRNRFSGFFVHGNGHVVTGNVAEGNGDNGFSLRGTNHVVAGNVARRHSDHGYDVRGGGHRLSANVATANSLHGFNVPDGGHTLSGNVASANVESGFEVGGSGLSFTGNSAHANRGAGFSLLGTGLRLAGNSILGNRGDGIFIGALAADVQITKSNIFGNGSPGGSFGVFNAAGQIQATDNFWGAATGPGSDPADDIFDDAVGSQTVFAPFATKPFKVKPLTSLGPAK